MSDLNEQLLDAVGKLIKAKGRYHTEQNYKAVVEAYDAARRAPAAAPAPTVLYAAREEWQSNTDNGAAGETVERIANLIHAIQIGDQPSTLLDYLNDWLSKAKVAAAPAPVAASDLQTALRLGLEAAQEVLSLRQHSLPRYTEEAIGEAKDAVATLRAALAAAPAAAPVVQPEPVAWMRNDGSDCKTAASKTWMESAGFGVWGDVAKLYQTPLYAAPTPASSTSDAKDAARLLNADELAALRRFAETCEDNEEYDVPKVMMRRLAAIGAIEWRGFSRYQITDFGDFVLDRAAIASSAGEVKP